MVEDSEIIRLYFARDERAIDETRNQYGGYCTTIAYNILASFEDTEECVSDTYLHTWNAIPPTKPGSLKYYVGRVTRNLALNRLRAGGAQKRAGTQYALCYDDLENMVSGKDSPEELVDAQALGQAISEFLYTLPRVKRNLFVLRYWYFTPIPVIAEKLGMGESTVRSELCRTRKKLRAYLLKEGFSL